MKEFTKNLLILFIGILSIIFIFYISSLNIKEGFDLSETKTQSRNEINNIINILKERANKIGDVIEKETNNVINVLETQTYKTGDKINDIINQLQNRTYKIIDVVQSETNNVISILKTQTYKIGDITQKEINAIINILETQIYKIIDIIQKETNDIINKLKKHTYQTGDIVEKETNDIINQLKTQTYKIGDIVENETNDIINILNIQTYKIGDIVKNETDDIINQLEKTTYKTGDSIKKETNDIINQLEKQANKTGDEIKNESTSIFKVISDSFNKYISKPISSTFNILSKNSIFYIILAIIFIFSFLYIIIRFVLIKEIDKTPNVIIPSQNTPTLFRKSLSILFGLVISGLLIFLLTYSIEKFAGQSSIVSFILILSIIILVLGLIYKTINAHFPVGNAKKNAFFNLITTILLYIPCIVSRNFDWFGKLLVGQYNSADAGSLMMLALAIGLYVIYFLTPSLLNRVSKQGGTQLVNKPVSTSLEYSLGTYQDLNGSENFDYQYAISCWIFIDASPPNTAPSYSKYTSLLNFGNKPNILYNAQTHTLMITMQQKDLQDVTKNKLIDFDSEGNRIIYTDDNFLLQKWNNIIINYNGGTLDIFLNGKLVKSSIEVVPYYTLDNLTIGENDGIKGGICNVVYFRRALKSNNIYYLYNLVKNNNPPISNDSSKTILVNNANI